MRVDQLELRNFKKFAEVSVSLHPRFTLLVGENGAGKTSILDALAVSLGVWLVDVHDSLLANSKRPIDRSEKRLESIVGGDRTQLQQAPGIVSVCSKGQILDRDGIEWGQEIRRGKNSVTNSRSKEAMAIISDAYARAGRGEKVLLPVIAYYGAGRAWLPHNQRKRVKAKSTSPSNRWEAFYDCLNDRIRLSDLNSWFRAEAIERGNRGGRYRPGFEVVLRAIMNCVPGADAMFYDSDRDQVVLSIDGNPQPFGNLSAGQRTLFSLVADIAIKMVTQNNYLVPPESLGPDDKPLPRVLTQTPGVILSFDLGEDMDHRNMVAALEVKGSRAEQFGASARTNDPLLVLPTQPDCESRFAFSESGRVRGLDPDDVDTIVRLRLNHTTLEGWRKVAMETFLDPIVVTSRQDLEIIVAAMDEPANGQLAEFSFCIKSVANQLL